MPLDSIEVGGLLEKWVPRAVQPQLGPDLNRAGEAQAPPVRSDLRFVPSRWLMALLAVAMSLFRGGRISYIGVAGLVWSFTPRKLKMVAAGLALAATIVLLGAIAAIALLALQLA